MTTNGSPGLSKKLHKLTAGGGLVFWATTVAISLLPIAAEYRASFADRSWSIQTVWVGSLVAGILIGFCVSYSLALFLNKNPTGNPILRSVILSLVALVVATILIDVPRSIHGSGDDLYYFLIGIVLNIPRFLLLGLAIGYLYRRLYASARPLDYSTFEGAEQ